MFTKDRPNFCPNCHSGNIILGCVNYKLDKDGYPTDKITSGSWFCNDCGNYIGRYENGISDIDNHSYIMK